MRASAVLLVLVLAAVVVLWARGSQMDERDDGASRQKCADTALPVRTPAGSLFAEIAGAASSAIAVELKRINSSAGGPAATPAKPPSAAGEPGVDWPGDYPRTSFELAAYVLTNLGELRPEQLLRHEVLNPFDRPVSTALVAQFQLVLDALNASVGDVAEAFDDIQREEMIASVDAGKVKPENSAPSRATRRSMAEMWKRKGLYPDLTVEQVMESDRAMALLSIQGNAFVHAGKVYRAEAFVELPRTDEVFPILKFIAFDMLACLGEWFVLHDLTDAQRLGTALGGFSQVTRMGLAAGGPKRPEPEAK